MGAHHDSAAWQAWDVCPLAQSLLLPLVSMLVHMMGQGADEILRAEVDDIGIELATGAVLEDDCVPSFWCFFQMSEFC